MTTLNLAPRSVEPELSHDVEVRTGLLKRKADTYAERITEHQYKFPVRYPSPTEIVRTAPESKLQINGWPMVADPATGEVYLVSPYVLRRSNSEIWDMCVWIGFALAVSHNGESFLWPYPAGIYASPTAAMAVIEARDRWVRVRMDKTSGDYHLDPQMWDFPTRRWKKLEHDDVVDIVFKEREICSLDHPVMRRIRGEVDV